MRLLNALIIALLFIVRPLEKPDVAVYTAPLYALSSKAVDQNHPQLPIYFEVNEGQVNHTIDFISRGSDYTLFLRNADAIFAANKGDHDSSPLQLSLVGGNPSPVVTGEAKQPGKSNYLIGRDPEGWQVNVPHFGRVRYEEVYEGIDLVYYSDYQGLQYDFILAPYADTAKIQLRISPVDALTVDAGGDLLVRTANRIMRHHAPVAYQTVEGKRVSVVSHFRLLGNDAVGFEVGDHDAAYPLVIDPVIEYSTYIGGSSIDDAWGVAADDNGYVYVTGRTESVDLLTSPGVLGQTLSGSRDTFVVKIDTNAAGTDSLVYATYLGGSGADDGWAIDIDDSGNAYVVGTTWSDDFPVTPSGFEQDKGQGECCSADAFLAKLNPSGTAMLYATYIGGTSVDEGYGVATDSSGNAYVVGTTRSDTFPTTVDAFLTSSVEGELQIFLTKIDTGEVGLNSLVYSTYFGGTDNDVPARGLAADDAGNVYLTGGTESGDFPVTPNAYKSTMSGVMRDAFLARIDTTQSGAVSLVYSTLIGGGGVENANTAGSVACDDNGHVYITGETTSPDFPVVGGFQLSYAGGPSAIEGANADAFVARINTNASGTASLEYSTYLGGYGFDQGRGIATTRQGNVYVAGQTLSSNFPRLYPVQSGALGDSGSFIAKIDTGTAGPGSLVYSSFLGRGSNSFGGVAVDSDGVAYGAGQIGGQAVGGHPGGVPIFPLLNGFQPTYGGNIDGYLVRLGFDADLSIHESDLDDLLLYGVEKTFTLLVVNDGPDAATGVEFTILIPPGMNLVSVSPDQGTCDNAGNTVTCELGNLQGDSEWTVDLTVIVPEAIVEQPHQPATLVNWSGRTLRATAQHAMIPRTWRTAVSPSGTSMMRMLLAPYGTPISTDAMVDGVERDLNVANNEISVVLNAIEGAVYSFSDEQVFTAISVEIASRPGPQDIDFVLPVVGSDGINMTVRTSDGTVGQGLITMTNNRGYLVIEIGRITVDGAPAPANYLQSINRELPLLVTRSLDTLVTQQAAPGYNLVRVTPTERGLEVIVEVP